MSAQPQPRGVPARARPADYAAQVTVGGVVYAASRVPADQLKHIFAFDIGKTYLVLEVALYPETASSANLDPDGFIVRSSPTGDAVRRSDSATIASVIQQKNLPPEPSKMGSVVASTEIGYESGRDPYTGQRVHGTYTATEVGINRPDNGPPTPPSPGGYPQDRELLERQLWDKGLPGGQVTQPTAGYLYFPNSLLKKKASSVYQLEYLGSGPEPVLNGKASGAIQLLIPGKNR